MFYTWKHEYACIYVKSYLHMSHHRRLETMGLYWAEPSERKLNKPQYKRVFWIFQIASSWIGHLLEPVIGLTFWSQETSSMLFDMVYIKWQLVKITDECFELCSFSEPNQHKKFPRYLLNSSLTRFWAATSLRLDYRSTATKLFSWASKDQKRILRIGTRRTDPLSRINRTCISCRGRRVTLTYCPTVRSGETWKHVRPRTNGVLLT